MTVGTNKVILSPIKIGNVQLGHRVVLAPLTRLRSTVKGVPTDMQLEYYKQRASKGGLLLTECAGVSPNALGYPQVPGIFSQEQIDGWRNITDAVHEKGGYIFLQLWHSGRTGKKHLSGDQIVSASAIAATGKDILNEPFEMPRALEMSEIKSITKDFAQAALNSIQAGFDGVEIHAAFGFLLDQFINTSSNIRTDDYGGSMMNRCRFTLEVVEAVVHAIGAERTGIRVSPGGGTFHSATEDFPVETCTYLLSQLQHNYPNMTYVHFMQTRTQENIDQDLAELYRSHWKGPIISSGFSLTTTTDDAELHVEKTGDLVAFGRLFISNPDLPERICQGHPLIRSDFSTFYTHEAKGYTDYPSFIAKK